jgi:hypothetical protein
VGDGEGLGLGLGEPGDGLGLGRLDGVGTGLVRRGCGRVGLGAGGDVTAEEDDPAEPAVSFAGATST